MHQVLVVFSRKIDMEFYAACALGLEKIVGEELKSAGVKQVRPLKGGVSFGDSLQDAQKAMQTSRVASRILQTLSRFEVSDANDLYAGVKNIEWQDYIGKTDSIAVHARGTNENLRDTRFTTLRTKDAICDKLREVCGFRPNVDTQNPDVAISIVFHRGKVTVSLDLSSAMHKRGYRASQHVQAPLRETMAAALVRIAGIENLQVGSVLWDPMCGCGTIAIEAALINPNIKIVASDIDARAIDIAKRNARAAGVSNKITFITQDIMKAKTQADIIITNPPYGQRLSSAAQLPALYAVMRTTFASCGAKRLILITSDETIDQYLHYKPQTQIQTYNGPLQASIRLYNLEEQNVPQEQLVKVRDKQVSVQDAGAQQFASRLNKVLKTREKWAKTNQVFAYRVYDADLPDFNMAIDMYDCAEAGRRVYVAEYAAPKEIDALKAQVRLTDALAIIPAVFEVPVSHIYCKQRRKSKGGSQYAGAGADAAHGVSVDGARSADGGRGTRVDGAAHDNSAARTADTSAARAGTTQKTSLVTCENKLFFEVDLSSYLDTGLFLDHRKTRSMIRVLAKDKTFLNLFAYTGTASVYAAAGGAKTCTSVDISNTYLEWAKRNMQLNNLAGKNYEFIRADAVLWAQEMRHSAHRWDLIFVDPPTFSNSAKMGKRNWEVQRDHAEFLICASRLLTPDGIIIFSCNLRKFKIDVQMLAKAGVSVHDITEKTIPEDFTRNRNIHHCYLLKRQHSPVLN